MSHTPDCTAILYQSFGGPESIDEVMPYLQRVTAGRNIPDFRLAEVAEHYYHFGGKSPINEQNRIIISTLEKTLQKHGYQPHIYFANRNSAPYVADALKEIIAAGHKNIYVLRTSAWGGYSGHIQYMEDIFSARDHLKAESLPVDDLQFIFPDPYFLHPDFLTGYTRLLQESHHRLREKQSAARIFTIFTAHSVPIGEKYYSALYAQQVEQSITHITEIAQITNFTLAWQSRSGPPQIPWLEPDIVETIEKVDASKYDAISLVPLGFITDHMEVMWDLDVEAMDAIRAKNLVGDRAETIGLSLEFQSLCLDLLKPYLAQ